MDVYGFRALVVEKAGGEVNELGEVLSTLVANPEAMSVGEDYVILSSAEFDTTEIIVTKRVGVDLIPAIAAVLPLERHVRWSKLGKLRSGLAESLLGESGFELGRAMLGKGVKTVVGRGGLVICHRPRAPFDPRRSLGV